MSNPQSKLKETSILSETERNELEILPREKHKFVHLEDYFNPSPYYLTLYEDVPLALF